MMTEPSFVQLVTQALMGADRPRTVAEIKARVEMIRPVRTRDPQATIRSAINNVPLAVSLGGRPARYTWWPRHLADNAFRQPLAASDLEAGTLALNREVWLALWPDFYAGSSRSPGEVTLVMSPFPLVGGRAGACPERSRRDGGHLTDGPVLQGRIEHLVAGQPVWGLPSIPALADWYRQQEATPDDALIVQVLDVDARRYAVALARRAERDEDAIAARNQALADAAEKVLRTARLSLPDFYLIPRLIAHDAYRHRLPPDPWEDVLRADLRFVVERRDGPGVPIFSTEGWTTCGTVGPWRPRLTTRRRCGWTPVIPMPGCTWATGASRRIGWPRRWPSTNEARRRLKRGLSAIRPATPAPFGAT